MTQVVLVTGGTSGIGKAAALAFAQNGYTVLVNGRDKQKGEACVAELLQAGAPQAEFLAADVTDPAAVKTMFQGIRDKYGILNVLINNAGNTFGGDSLQASPEVLLHGMQLNFFSAFYCTQAADKLMDNGAIVNVGSVCGIEQTPSGEAFAIPIYAAAKAALHNFSQNAAQLLAPRIRVNAILPGYTKTPAWNDVDASEKELSYQPLIGRFSEAEEVAAAIYMLATNQAMTGSLVVVDGGLTVHDVKGA